MVPKKDLTVDTAYQRDIKEARVLAIARDWSWISCGVILVALRPSDAAYMVIDGQHRKAAADRRSDITDLPCMIFEIDDISEEASGFLSANTLRRPLSMVERFKALTITNDKDAEVVKALAGDAGRTIASYATETTITCVRTIMDCARADERSLRAVWPIITDLCVGHPIPNEIVKGMFHLQTHLQDGVSLTDGKWRGKILACGYARIIECVRQAAGYRGQSNPKVFAEGIVKALNTNAKIKIPHAIPGID